MISAGKLPRTWYKLDASVPQAGSHGQPSNGSKGGIDVPAPPGESRTLERR